MENNAYLAMRIKHIILEEYRHDILAKPEVSLKFFVRDKLVQKASGRDVFELQEEDMVLKRKDGMDKQMMKVLFRLIERALGKYKKIDYAHIFITYKLNDARDGFENMRIEIENEKHYKYHSIS